MFTIFSDVSSRLPPPPQTIWKWNNVRRKLLLLFLNQSEKFSFSLKVFSRHKLSIHDSVCWWFTRTLTHSKWLEDYRTKNKTGKISGWNLEKILKRWAPNDDWKAEDWRRILVRKSSSIFFCNLFLRSQTISPLSVYLSFSRLTHDQRIRFLRTFRYDLFGGNLWEFVQLRERKMSKNNQLIMVHSGVMKTRLGNKTTATRLTFSEVRQFSSRPLILIHSTSIDPRIYLNINQL